MQKWHASRARLGAFALTAVALLSACPAKVVSFTSRDAGRRDVQIVCAACAEVCPAPAEWLPVTGAFVPIEPEPHPSTHCPFYQSAWQNFLIATQPDPQGEAAFRHYATIDDVFVRSTPLVAGALAPVGELRGTFLRAALGNIKQAPRHEILIDQNGHPIYYGIHLNQAFADFIHQHGLDTLSAVIDADPTLSFPPGVVELKSAWQEIDVAHAQNYANFITTTAWVPILSGNAQTRAVSEDPDHPRQVRLALLAVHVVFALVGHPELIWASFEHVDASGVPDVAPTAADNPPDNDPTSAQTLSAPSAQSFLLYRGNTPANAANKSFVENDLLLDEARQSFDGQQTSVYRVFPASKSNWTNLDGALLSLNHGVSALFSASRDAGALGVNDKRGNYRLVGATWMDKPVLLSVDSSLQNDSSSPLLQGDVRTDVSQADERQEALRQGVSPLDALRADGPESPFSIIGGEDRMSSTAMESFTQTPASFFNCFTCHNTMGISENGIPVSRDPTGRKLMDPKLINMSHVFSQFLLEETR